MQSSGQPLRDVRLDSVLYLVSRFFPALSTFAVISYLTHRLEPDDFGFFVIVFSAILLVSSLASVWIGIAVVRLLPASPRPGTLLVTANVIFACQMAILLVLALYALFVFSPPRVSPGLVSVAVMTSIAGAWIEVGLSALMAQGRAGQYAAVQLVRSVALVGFIVIAADAQGTITATVSAMCGSVLAAAAMLAWLQRRSYSGSFSFVVAGDLLRFGAPLVPGAATEMSMYYADRFIIAVMLNVGAVGVYGASVDICGRPLRMIFDAVGAGALPAAVASWDREGASGAARQMRHNMAVLLLLGAPATVGLLMVGPSFVTTFIGPEFRQQALELLPLVCISTFVVCFRRNYLDHALHITLRSVLLSKITIGAAMVQVLGTILLLPAVGVAGALWAALLAAIIGVGIIFLAGSQQFKIPFDVADVSGIGLATAAMGLAIFLLPELTSPARDLLLQVGVGAVVYGAAILVVNVLGFRDLLFGSERNP